MRKMLYQKESNYNRLRRAKMDKSMFVKIKTLGIGAFGEVCLTRKVDTGALYAMKTLRKKDVLNRNQVSLCIFIALLHSFCLLSSGLCIFTRCFFYVCRTALQHICVFVDTTDCDKMLCNRLNQDYRYAGGSREGRARYPGGSGQRVGGASLLLLPRP